jgi:hypothetical protein
MSYEKKYLKYKNKYQQLKLNQLGGALLDFLHKERDTITFPKGFTELHMNGSYNLIHNSEYYNINNTLEKVNQLKNIIEVTLKNNPAPPTGANFVNKVSNIYNSDKRQDLIDIITYIFDHRA